MRVSTKVLRLLEAVAAPVALEAIPEPKASRTVTLDVSLPVLVALSQQVAEAAPRAEASLIGRCP